MQLVYNIFNILNDGFVWLAITSLASLVLRQEKRHRDDERSIRQTHDAIMREVRER